VFDTITTDTFRRSQIVIPPADVLRRCEDTIAPLFRRILMNTEISKTLAELRDTLLPRLISGKLRVPEAEKLVEAVP
jgi:type I restriction enzyme S subunit